MCEFKVLLGGERVFDDAVYVVDDGKRLIVKDVLGQSKEFDGYHVVEISVEREELVITKYG
ncbi:CooT family nickel-binding protein [Candidatus Bathyarchaeota archaeon]|nr:CooT family nickel-binding protein [Candidatus Bathyarchaeota archaeon]